MEVFDQIGQPHTVMLNPRSPHAPKGGALWLTRRGVDEVLVGEARMVYVVNGRGEDGRKDLQVGEHRL